MKRTIAILTLCITFVTIKAEWTQLNNIPFIDNHSNGFGVDGKAYVIQGTPSGTSSKNQLWEYNPSSDEWFNLGDVPGPTRTVAIGDDMNGKFYFGFGVNKSDLWEFDPVSQSFTELPSCPCTPRSHPAFVAHNDKIYMGSGSSNNGDLKDWWIYDFETETWSQKQDIPGNNRHHPFQFGIEDAIYVGGGHQGDWYKWDINNETWSAIDDLPSGRVAGTQFSYQNRGYVLSGDNASHEQLPNNQFLMYDPEVDEWYNLPFDEDMHRWAPSSFIVDNYVYYFGGYSNGSTNPDNARMWRFDLENSSCFAPSEVYAFNISDTESQIFYGSSISGSTDSLFYRIVGAQNWEFILNPISGLTINNLEPCSEYEFRVNVNCGTEGIIYSGISRFNTKGCGVCIDESYCDVSNEFYGFTCFIEKVQLNSYENISGSNDGYEDFGATNEVEVHLGEDLELSLEIGFDFFGNEYYDSRIAGWIDFNSNGLFDSEEQIFNVTQNPINFNETVNIPVDAIPGLTKLRLMVDVENLSGPCSGTNWNGGEVEDYCIILVDSTLITEPVDTTNTPTDTTVTNINIIEEEINKLHIYPNPFNRGFQCLVTGDKPEKIQIYDIIGNLVFTYFVDPDMNKYWVDLGDVNLNDGVYFLRLLNKHQQVLSQQKIIKR